MRRWLYAAGKALQALSLAVLPLAIWVGHLGRDEAGAIGIFAGSLAAFAAGTVLTRAGGG